MNIGSISETSVMPNQAKPIIAALASLARRPPFALLCAIRQPPSRIENTAA